MNRSQSTRGIRRERINEAEGLSLGRRVRRRHYLDIANSQDIELDTYVDMTYGSSFSRSSQDELISQDEDEVDMESTMQDQRPRMQNLTVGSTISPMDSVNDISTHIRSLQRLGVINSAQADEAILQSREHGERQAGDRALNRISIRRHDDGGSLTERIAARREYRETTRLDSSSRATAREARETSRITRPTQFITTGSSSFSSPAAINARRDFILANRTLQQANAARQIVGTSAIHRRLQFGVPQGTTSSPHRPRTRSRAYRQVPSVISPIESLLTVTPPALSDSSDDNLSDDSHLDRAMQVIRAEINANNSRAEERMVSISL
jgi:hypothetical protein